MLDALAEPESGIDCDAPSIDSMRTRALHPFAQKLRDFLRHFAIDRRLLHRARRALHVHQHQAAIAVRHGFEGTGLLQCSHVIDDRGTRC